MNRTFTIARKELQGYFNSPVGWLFVIVFLVSCSVLFFFLQSFFAIDRADLRGFFGIMPLLFSILLPALTMRLWAEEKKQGTYEFLMTMPYTETQLVLGKYLATMGVVGFSLLLTLPVPLMVSLFGSLDAGTLVAEYFGMLLLASASSAIGQLISSKTNNQINAFILSVIVLAALNLMGQLGVLFDLPEFFTTLINWLSLNHHVVGFSRGMLDTRDLMYFVILSAAALYATAKSIVFGRWR
ncbi:MAG: ABC transporter permease [Spirochaetes bacterium]|nr:ABC transporter permease [Spirochaetota bacterium]MBU0955500.1 ABC transporter permease [Spirochaetota bacterium]